MSTFVENQTSTCGNTSRRLRTIPATTESGSWYSWIHWPKTPSSARRARTMWKNSGVYSADAPHPGDVREHARRDAAPEADHEGGGGVRPRRGRSEAEHDLGVHVGLIGRVDLAVHAEGATAERLPHAHGGVPALPERELPGPTVGEERLTRRGAHGLAGVDGGTQIDEPGAPAGRAERDPQGDARERAGAEHAQAQRAMLSRTLRHAARREPGQREGRDAVDQ